MDKTISSSELSKAIAFYPTLRAFSEVLGVRYQVVQQWLANGVPAEYCPQIERLTNGAVKCEDLNDKIDWSYLRNSLATQNPLANETNEEIRRETDLGCRQPADPKKVDR